MSYTPQWGPGQSGQSQPGTYGQPVSGGGYGQPGGYDTGSYGGQGQGGYGGNQGGQGGYGGQGGQGQGGFGGQGGGFGGNQGGQGGYGGNQGGFDQYGGQGGNQFGGQQQPFGGFGPPSGPPPQPPRRRRFGGLVRFLVLIAIVGGLAVAYPVVIRPALAKLGNDAAKEAEEEAKEGAKTAAVGECVIDRNAPGASAPADSDDVKLRVVPCDGPEAGYKVVGIVQNKLQAEANADDVCAAYPDADVVYWEGYTGRAGLVLCLQTLKK